MGPFLMHKIVCFIVIRFTLNLLLTLKDNLNLNMFAEGNPLPLL